MRGGFSRWLVNVMLRFLRGRLAAVDIAKARVWAARVDGLLGRVPADVTLSDVVRPTWRATWIDVPAARRDRVILYLHGGAFALETPRVHTQLVAQLARGAQARAFMVSYRLAPEHPFPAAVDDCLAAYRHLLDSGHAAADIVIAGDSAGGNLALVTTIAARDAGLALPAAVVAFSPFTDGTFSGDSIARNDGHDPLFRPAIFNALADVYAPGADPRDPRISPLFADLRGLPPALLQVGSGELLLDDSVRYATRARDVTLEVWHGMPHVFVAFSLLRESAQGIEHACAYMRTRFEAAKVTSARAAAPV